MSRHRRRRRSRRSEHQRGTAAKRTVIAGAGLSLGVTLIGGTSADAATFTVSNLNDSGAGSLRQAMLDANAAPGADQVTFQSTLSGQITLGSQLPTVTDAVDVLGPGANQLTVSGNNNSRIFYVDPVVHGSPVTISGLTLTAGKAAMNNGGAIRSKYAKLTVSGTVISGNTATYSGGGIRSSRGSLTVRSSTISGNSAQIGGGVYLITDDPDVVQIENSTITGNTATFFGGGIAFPDPVSSGATLAVKGSTIAANTAGNPSYSYTGGGGMFVTRGASSSVINTVVADNTAVRGPDIRVYHSNSPLPATFSLVENTTDAAITGAPNIFGQDPKLGPLAANGGPTPTMRLGEGSPAIDQGASQGLTSDQRGVLRPIDFPSIPNAAGGDGSDIGAFELQPDNAINLGKLKRNKKKGTAKQIVILPLPDAGSVTIQGKGLKTKTMQVHDNGRLKLPVIPKGKTKRAENSTGKAKVKAKITYQPTGNASKTLKRKLKLRKRLP